MSFLIQLTQAGFQMKVSAFADTGDKITTKVERTKLTGEMPTLEKYLDTYEQLNELLSAYKELIKEDAIRLKSAQAALTFAESQILK